MFKADWSTHLITFLGGALLAFLMAKGGCVDTPIKTIDTGGWIQHHYDTVTQIITRDIPTPIVTYRTKKEIEVQYKYKHDTLEFVDGGNIIWTPDTLTLRDTNTNNELIAINHYEDSISTDQYKLKWTAETIGELTSMVPEVTIYQDSVSLIQLDIVTKKPKWTIQGGISNRLNYKIGGGYKGWLIESEFHNAKFNQIYLTKQFQF